MRLCHPLVVLVKSCCCPTLKMGADVMPKRLLDLHCNFVKHSSTSSGCAQAVLMCKVQGISSVDHT